MDFKLNSSKIYKLIDDKGLKKGFLIDNCGASRGTFYKYINGTLEAPLLFASKLANMLGVEINSIKE